MPKFNAISDKNNLLSTMHMLYKNIRCILSVICPKLCIVEIFPLCQAVWYNKVILFFYGSVRHKSILINVQRDATICSLYIVLLQNHSKCFGCCPHPLSGVHKTVVAATGTVHIICGATSLQRCQVGHVGVR